MTAAADTADALATPAGDAGSAQVVQMPPARQTGQITRSPYGFAPTPPQSITSFVAGIAEPLLSVLALLVITVLADEPIDRATQLLSLGVLVLTFPGTNRFHATPWVALGGIVSSWLVVCSVLALVGFATDSIKFYTPEVLAAWLVAAMVALPLRRLRAALDVAATGDFSIRLAHRRSSRAVRRALSRRSAAARCAGGAAGAAGAGRDGGEDAVRQVVRAVGGGDVITHHAALAGGGRPAPARFLRPAGDAGEPGRVGA